MNNKFLIIFLIFASSFQVKAESQILKYLIDYGIPCAVGFGLGQMAKNSEDKMAIGLSVCGAVSTSTYLNSQRKELEYKDEDFKKFLKLMNDQMEQKMVEIESQQKKENEDLKLAIKEVIADRLVIMEEQMKSDIRSYMERNEFMEEVEKKAVSRLTETVGKENKVNQKVIIEQCINEVINQITIKKYGSPKIDLEE